ncbi:hypothetical protein AAFF_G00162750 [Aldrovandia affinis]|uniref:Costars domain-containing protein n=1 Tax=Aldrovandia affinis TaxID=143900 RepID=A0AAD7SZ57_9TELE|nr:hypothetical protein AAFF_G00162750 [Aldrovandia affinis]
METEDAAAQCDITTEPYVISVKGLKDNWQKWCNDHREYQKHNPFSNGGSMTAQPQRGQEGYGRPPEGSRTEARGKEAHSRLGREVEELCQAIRDLGEGREGGRPAVRFGTLFEHYVDISSKVVGVLLRARKQGLVHFEGEMLWQGRDDHVLITLLH